MDIDNEFALVLEGKQEADVVEYDEAIRNAMQVAKDDNGQWLSAEVVFERLVQDAMEKFGEAPRDITEAALYPLSSTYTTTQTYYKQHIIRMKTQPLS